MPVSYLRIRGMLSDDMTYVPRQGMESSRPFQMFNGDPDYSLVSLDASDGTLVTSTPMASELACGPVHAPSMIRISGILPINARTVAYELRKNGITFYRGAIAASPPEIPEIRADETSDGATIRWSSGGFDALSYSIVAEIERGPRVTLARDVKESEFSFDWRAVPLVGIGQIFVVCHNGARSRTVEALKFQLPMPPPTAVILSLDDDQEHSAGQPLSLIGACIDAFGRTLAPDAIEWHVDDVVVSRGSLLAVTWNMEVGSREIRLALRIGREVFAAQTKVMVVPSDASRLESFDELTLSS